MHVTQYNWGYPAALKNALDFLYREWNNKPAAIISYGGRGGGKAAAQLQEVSPGFWMLVLDCPSLQNSGVSKLLSLFKSHAFVMCSPVAMQRTWTRVAVRDGINRI